MTKNMASGPVLPPGSINWQLIVPKSWLEIYDNDCFTNLQHLQPTLSVDFCGDHNHMYLMLLDTSNFCGVPRLSVENHFADRHLASTIFG
jgi:hypothetical protein